MAAESAKTKKTTRPAEQSRRLVWLSEAQAALGWGVILILVALLGAIYLNQTSRIATVGRRVQILQNNLDAIKRENATLERDVAGAQALDRLQLEAVRLGFRRALPEDIEYVIVSNYPVMDEMPLPLEIATPVADPAETMQEALWLAVRASIGDLIRGESP